MRNTRRRLVGALVLSAATLVAAAAPRAAEPQKHHHRHHRAAVKKPARHAAPAKTGRPAAAAKPAAAAAIGTHALGKADSWTAYVSEDSSGRVCYLAGPPQKSEPAGLARKPPMAIVTHRPTEKIANVVSFVEGYPLKEGSDVALAIGSTKFELFTKDDSAWARTADLDKAIVAALSKGREAVVTGIPPKGPPTTDIYPLAGFAKALALIDKACGVRR